MWHLEGQLASYHHGRLTLNVSLMPDDRKVLVQTSDQLLLANLWDLSPLSGLPLAEAYVRQNDLVCRLSPSDTFPFYTELYWTLREVTAQPAPLVALSLLVSVRTDLLDTHPEVEVVTEAAGCDATSTNVGDDPAFLIPLREGVTLVDFAASEDCAEQQLTNTPDVSVAIRRKLFSHFLEKGVIRRGRLFATLVEGEVNQSYAATLCQQLASAELPLTT